MRIKNFLADFNFYVWGLLGPHNTQDARLGPKSSNGSSCSFPLWPRGTHRQPMLPLPCPICGVILVNLRDQKQNFSSKLLFFTGEPSRNKEALR